MKSAHIQKQVKSRLGDTQVRTHMKQTNRLIFKFTNVNSAVENSVAQLLSESIPQFKKSWFDEVLKTLAHTYECNYPWCNDVQTGLRRVLLDRYGKDSQQFKDKFVHQTLHLLGKLKEENFPLCLPNGQVVVHLVPPAQDLFIGEFYYQIGHTRPGTLAVKFAKYRDNTLRSVLLQPSEVDDFDYDIAFTKEFFQEVRRMAEGAGDVLMRTLLVLCAPNWTVSKVNAVDYLQTCPSNRQGRLRSDSHLSVQESSEESSWAAEANFPCEHVDTPVSEKDDPVFDSTRIV